jgi:predicted O-linked N-acetylglucosamine transferase (SPINDLY family)
MNQPDPAGAVAAAKDALLRGEADDAVAALQAHIEANPADFEARYVLSSLCYQLGDPALGEQVMNEARTLQALAAARAMGADIAALRADRAYADQVATTLYAQNLVAVSSVVRGMAIEAGQAAAESVVSYGLSLQHQGRIDEACEVFEAAAKAFPGPQIEQFGLFPQLFREGGAARYFEAAVRWAQRHAPGPPFEPHANPPRAGRKLRIGYVAPSIAGTQLRLFMTPLIENHDPAKVEVTLYVREAASESSWPEHVRVRAIGQLCDADAAAVIRADGIDVLADCWGHTAGSRLSMFALRPAPVQVAWLNFIQTTGLSQIDYLLHADGETPAGVAGRFSEAIWPIGPVFCVYRPSSERLPPIDTPARRAGMVTFGSFNHPAKLSYSVIETWAAVLRHAPGSRLLLKYAYFVDPVLQRSVQARFAGFGVDPSRVVFAGHSRGADYHASFGLVDLALDTWPAPGSTTTMEALSNGVPVLSLDGPEPTLQSRYAASILHASDLSELVADSREAYVIKAVELSEDVEALSALRARIRPRFETGGCCDEAGFTARIEDAFGQMFDRWREQPLKAGA